MMELCIRNLVDDRKKKLRIIVQIGGVSSNLGKNHKKNKCIGRVVVHYMSRNNNNQPLVTPTK